MNFLRARKVNKIRKQLLHDAAHARHMREDLAKPAVIEALDRSVEGLNRAWNQRDEAAFHRAAETLMEDVNKIYPPHKAPKMRENLEIFVVAISIAMGVRTYFVQPFKIPTGSMQETLHGIKVTQDYEKTFMDIFPLKIVKYLAAGTTYKEVRARTSGVAYLSLADDGSNNLIIDIAGTKHAFNKEMKLYVNHGSYVNKGDVLSSGLVKAGDHILVNKIKYNFVRPERGDIIVFSTEFIKHPQIRENTYYIKRLVGLPGDLLGIVDGRVNVNGEAVNTPKHFATHKYILASGHPSMPPPKLGREDDRVKIPAAHYMVFGDNTYSSLDSRYFGTIQQESVLGPAFAIYWPFLHRFGIAR